MNGKKLTRKDFHAAEKLVADRVLAAVCPQHARHDATVANYSD
ncbi:MAG TPA: hypothetical protein VJS30_23145 [Paraburkholderia sp.]|nr:hypothetical protein [Paraburkholderia sp.]